MVTFRGAEGQDFNIFGGDTIQFTTSGVSPLSPAVPSEAGLADTLGVLGNGREHPLAWSLAPPRLWR